jgi:hypothetical protein
MVDIRWWHQVVATTQDTHLIEHTKARCTIRRYMTGTFISAVEKKKTMDIPLTERKNGLIPD